MVASTRGDILNAAPDPLVGKTITGKYRVREVLARGGMGVIYKAEQVGLGRAVALKMLLTKREGHETFEQRFSLEAATLAKLKHPNTVTLYDYGYAEDAEQFFMAMEFVEGHNLARLVKEEGAFPPARSLKLIYECARALQEAHSLGIVHRDLKPANIMISTTAEGETVKVLDFGIAKLIEPDPERLDLTDDQTMLGSPKFMAPEQIRAGSPLDARTDVYSLGAVLYFLLAGIEPFCGDTQVQTLMAHLSLPVPPIAERSKQAVPPQVEAIARKCLAKEPKDRYASMDELKTAIRGVLGELEGGATNPTLSRKLEFTEEAGRGGNGPPLALIGGGVALLLLGVGLLAVVGVAAVSLGLVASASVEGGSAAIPAASPLAAPAPVTPPVTPPVAPEPAHVPELTITSDPPGASVMEAGASLGTTPLTLPWEIAAGADPRHLVVVLDGYDDAKIDVGTLDADTRQHVPLSKKAVVKAVPKVTKPPGGTGKTDGKPDDKPVDENLILER